MQKDVSIYGSGEADKGNGQLFTFVAAYSAHDDAAAAGSAEGKRSKSQRESGEGTVVVPLLAGGPRRKNARRQGRPPRRRWAISHFKRDPQAGSQRWLDNDAGTKTARQRHWQGR